MAQRTTRPATAAAVVLLGCLLAALGASAASDAGSLDAAQAQAFRKLQQAALTDPDILNFALNLEYLEANFYSCAAYGVPIRRSLWGAGGVAPRGCRRARLTAEAMAYAAAIANDEIAHVALLRSALGSAAVAQPLIDIGPAFVAAANAAVNATLSPPFDAYANDLLFYHAAFIFEDVGVTAYKGALRFISNKDILETAGGILAVEAYHGGAIRLALLQLAQQVVFPYNATVTQIIQAISNLRAAAAGARDDQGLFVSGNRVVLAPADRNAVAFSRTPQQVLRIVYLGGATKGGFFPNGLNGALRSAA